MLSYHRCYVLFLPFLSTLLLRTFFSSHMFFHLSKFKKNVKILIWFWKGSLSVSKNHFTVKIFDDNTEMDYYIGRYRVFLHFWRKHCMVKHSSFNICIDLNFGNINVYLTKQSNSTIHLLLQLPLMKVARTLQI